MRRFALLLATALTLAVAPSALAGKAHPHDPALDGYCPVAYHQMKQAMKGDAKFTSVRKGVRYSFVNADAKKMFDADPAKYEVAYGGSCAMATAMGQRMKGDPTLFTLHEGRTYLFSSAEAKKMFDADPAMAVKKADAHWSELARRK